MNAELLRTLCLSMKGVTEDVKWGNDLCFLIGEKIFCVTGLSGTFGVSLKVKDDEFEEMILRRGIIPAPYLARAKWIYIDKGDALTKKEWEYFISQSYRLIASKLTKNVKQRIGIK